jgi:hypothetical protein
MNLRLLSCVGWRYRLSDLRASVVPHQQYFIALRATCRAFYVHNHPDNIFQKILAGGRWASLEIFLSFNNKFRLAIITTNNNMLRLAAID